MMKLSLAIVGQSLPRPASIREKTVRAAEIAAALKIVADQIVNCGARDGKIEGSTVSGSYCIEGF
jgi:hypothetical protein